MKAKYINPFTDFGFKKIFAEEANKPLLIDFLNTLLPEKSQINNLSFKNPENLGQTIFDSKSIFDIYCEAAFFKDCNVKPDPISRLLGRDSGHAQKNYLYNKYLLRIFLKPFKPLTHVLRIFFSET